MRRPLVAVLVLAVALAMVALPLAGRLLVVADPLPASADAIVVLAGSIPTRVLEAGDLYRSGLAPRVVVTRERLLRGDAALRARGVRLPESDELTLAALEQLGVPPHAIIRLRRRTRSTISSYGVILWALVATLMTPARMPVSPTPSVNSRMKTSVISLTPSPNCARNLK